MMQNEAIKALLMRNIYESAGLIMEGPYVTNVTRLWCRYENPESGEIIEAGMKEPVFQAMVDEYGLRSMFEELKAKASLTPDS